MIDLHAHIVFGIDDGARSFEESKEMIKLAIEHGTSIMVATSHFIPETFPYAQALYFERLKLLSDWIESENLPFQLVSGNELLLSRSGIKALIDKQCLTINNSHYVLVETASFMQLIKIEELIDLLIHNGFKPIIAHTERLPWVLEDFKVILEWYENGCIFQVNAESFINKQYKENYKSAFKLLKNGLVHIIASDGHRQNHRQPILSHAYTEILKKTDIEYVEKMFYQNQMRILDDKPIHSFRKIKNNQFFNKIKINIKKR